jgi:hypothetical protein
VVLFGVLRFVLAMVGVVARVNYTQTKQKLEELENERSKRIWGD